MDFNKLTQQQIDPSVVYLLRGPPLESSRGLSRQIREEHQLPKHPNHCHRRGDSSTYKSEGSVHLHFLSGQEEN